MVNDCDAVAYQIQVKQEQISSKKDGLEALKSDQARLVENLKIEDKQFEDLLEREDALKTKLQELEVSSLVEVRENVRNALEKRLELVKRKEDREASLEEQTGDLVCLHEECATAVHAISEANRDLYLMQIQFSAMGKSNIELIRTEKNRDSALSHQIDSTEQRIRFVISEISQLQHAVNKENHLKRNLERELVGLKKTSGEVRERVNREEEKAKTLSEQQTNLQHELEKKESDIFSLKKDIREEDSSRIREEIASCRSSILRSENEIEREFRESRKTEQQLSLKLSESIRIDESATKINATCDEICLRIDGLRALSSEQLKEKQRLESSLRGLETDLNESKLRMSNLTIQHERAAAAVREKSISLVSAKEECESNRFQVETRKSIIASTLKEIRNCDRLLLSQLHRLRALQGEFSELEAAKEKTEKLINEINAEKLTISQLESCIGDRVNVHRWCILLETNPGLITVIQELHALQSELLQAQQRLLLANDRVSRKKQLIGEMRKLDCAAFRDKIKTAISCYRMQKMKLKENLEILSEKREEIERLGSESIQVQMNLREVIAQYVKKRWHETVQ